MKQQNSSTEWVSRSIKQSQIREFKRQSQISVRGVRFRPRFKFSEFLSSKQLSISNVSWFDRTKNIRLQNEFWYFGLSLLF